jgi:SAM-dependent methyltransferase
LSGPDVTDLQAVRRSRRHPRPTQFDYLHLKRLTGALARAFSEVEGEVHDVLDVYCGARPYEDLLPAGARCIGMDIHDRFGVADVVSDEFLPFPDQSFDLVLCTEAFQYVDPIRGVTEMQRVLRPGGRAIVTVSLVWEYDRTTLERRYTGPELAVLFDDWEGVEVTENGGFAISWALLTGRIVRGVEEHATAGVGPGLAPLFSACYAVINALGWVLDRAERRYPPERYALPVNLLLTADRPAR